MAERALSEASPAKDAAFQWRYSRLLGRVTPVVEELLAEYASSYCMRAFQRRDVKLSDGAGVCWLIDREVVVDLVYRGREPVEVLVHDIALVRPLRRRLRSRHVHVAFEPSTSPS